MTLASTVQIRWVDRADQISRSLWDECFPPPLEGYWWYSSLERSGISDQFTFSYAIIIRDGVEVGIAPTFVMDLPLSIVAPEWVNRSIETLALVSSRFQYQRTLFVGSPCADEGTIGLLPSQGLGAVVPGLLVELQERAQRHGMAMIVWKDLPADSDRKIRGLLKRARFFSLASYPGNRVDLRGKGFDDYLRSLSHHQRYQLKKKIRLSREMGNLDESVVQAPDDRVLEEIFRLYLKTYEHGKTKFERLTPEFFRLIASHPVSYFVLLRDAANGKLIAFMLCFLMEGRMINKFIGLDYSYQGHWFLYFRLWEAAVKWAFSVGAEAIQSGQTGYMSKHNLGHSLVPLTNYCRHLNPVVHLLFKTIARFITWSTLDPELEKISTKQTTSAKSLQRSSNCFLSENENWVGPTEVADSTIRLTQKRRF